MEFEIISAIANAFTAVATVCHFLHSLWKFVKYCKNVSKEEVRLPGASCEEASNVVGKRVCP